MLSCSSAQSPGRPRVPDVLQVWEADLVGPGVELDEWNDWYDTEHMAAILAVPGMRFGWRLRREPTNRGGTAPPEHMAVYLLDSCRVLASEAYDLARRSAGPNMRPELTARMLSAMGRLRRGLYETSHADALMATVADTAPWYVQHGDGRDTPPASAISWERFACSTVERAIGLVRPARSAPRLTLSRASRPAALEYRTVFAAAASAGHDQRSGLFL
jgi:hypothetical protein